jgi:hypothetical protein
VRNFFEQHLSFDTADAHRLAGSLVMIFLIGCGSNEFGSTVKGVVTLDGKPITPGLVTFAPEDPSAVPAVSDLDPNGSFELTTNKKPGLAPGNYRVAIQAFRPPDIPEGQRTMTPSEPLVPEKYFDVNTSGLEFTVEPGANVHNIELTSQ